MLLAAEECFGRFCLSCELLPVLKVALSCKNQAILTKVCLLVQLAASNGFVNREQCPCTII